jgi:hypothetical protein
MSTQATLAPAPELAEAQEIPQVTDARFKSGIAQIGLILMLQISWFAFFPMDLRHPRTYVISLMLGLMVSAGIYMRPKIEKLRMALKRS